MKGFTLVEMLVALLVFSLLSAAGVAVMAYTVDNQGAVGERLDRLAQVQRARVLLRQDLAQAAPRRLRDIDGRAARNAFHGAPDGVGDPLLALVRRGLLNPEQLPRGSLQQVQYRLVDGRIERSSSDALDGVAVGAPQVILEGVRNLRIAYFHDQQWTPAWPGGREALPEAIRLDFELDGVGPMSQLFLLPGQPR